MSRINERGGGKEGKRERERENAVGVWDRKKKTVRKNTVCGENMAR